LVIAISVYGFLLPQRRRLMPTEALRRVRETEEKAEDLIDSAYYEADRILADARTDAARTIDAAQDKVRREITFIRSSLDKEAQREIESINSRTAAERESMRGSAEARMGQSVETVLKAVGLKR